MILMINLCILNSFSRALATTGEPSRPQAPPKISLDACIFRCCFVSLGREICFGLGSRFRILGFRIQGFRVLVVQGFRVLGFRISGLGFGFGFRVTVLGFGFTLQFKFRLTFPWLAAVGFLLQRRVYGWDDPDFGFSPWACQCSKMGYGKYCTNIVRDIK